MPDPDMAQFTSVFRAGQRNRIKRNRQPVSCMACQRRKSKCDKRQPCGACEKRGDGRGCKYGSVSVSAKAAGVGEGSRQEVQLRLAKLEELVKGLASSSPQFPGQAAAGLAALSAAGITPSAGAGADGNKGSPADSTAAANYHGATSWAALVDSIHDIQHLLQSDELSDLSANEQDELEAADPFLGNLPAISVTEAHNSLPSRSDSDRLITCYFSSKFQAIPFLHTGQFRRQYEAFWANPSSVNLLWISIIFSVISSGALIAKVRYAHDPLLLQAVEKPHHYLQLSARCLIAGQYLSSKQSSVEALLQHAHSRSMQRIDADHVIWALYGLAVRLAQRKGYHRDPDNIGGSRLTPFEAEMRRRVWFMVQTSDLLFSFQAGMPPMVSESVVDTKHPTNLLDEDFDEDSPSLPPARGEADPTPILAYLSKAKLAVILRRVMLHALAVERPPFEETMRLNEQLEAWHAAMPKCLHIRTIRETAFTDANYTIMHRIMLELMYLKCLCVLHRPYLSSRGDMNPAHAVSRDICRTAALKMLDMHVELDYEVKPEGRMYEDRFMVSNLTLQHFLLASTVVCVELSESQQLSPEERAHRISVLRTSLAIWTQRSSYSSDARHAARVLRAVLSKVDGTAPSPQQSETTTSTSANTDFTSSPSTNGRSPMTTSDYTSTGNGNTMNLRNGFGAGMTMDFGNANQITPQQQQQQQQRQSAPMGSVQEEAYPTFTPGGEFTDAQFPLDLEEMPDMDTLLYSTEALNWKSIDQFLQLDMRMDNAVDNSWTTMLQGL